MRFILPLIVLLFFGSAKASTPSVDQAQDYLNNLYSMATEFIQVAPNGDVSTGMFFLKRPGKLRWQYNPPVPILIVARDNKLVYHDTQLDQISYLNIDENLVGLLTRKDLMLSGDITVQETHTENNLFYLTLVQTKKPEDGALTLVFEVKPFQLRQMEVKDLSGQITNITFNNPEFDVQLDDKIFNFKNPRIFKPKKK